MARGHTTRALIGRGSLSNFPHYRTFFQNPPAAIDLSAKQVSMLSHLTWWNVVESEAAIRDLVETGSLAFSS